MADFKKLDLTPEQIAEHKETSQIIRDNVAFSLRELENARRAANRYALKAAPLSPESKYEVDMIFKCCDNVEKELTAIIDYLDELDQSL